MPTEGNLLARCQEIAGMSLGQLATQCLFTVPDNPLKRKGFAGKLIELALGAQAGNQALPDFIDLGIELKTIPVNHLRKPAESTFVTSIPLLSIHQETWETSQCFKKLKRVLWVPVEDDKRIPYSHRRIGQAILWSPTATEQQVLARDWSDLVLLVSTGKLAEIDASMGTYLQIRPKAANAKSLCYGFDEHGNRILTLPRGFYLRSSFTARILA